MFCEPFFSDSPCAEIVTLISLFTSQRAPWSNIFTEEDAEAYQLTLQPANQSQSQKLGSRLQLVS